MGSHWRTALREERDVVGFPLQRFPQLVQMNWRREPGGASSEPSGLLGPLNQAMATGALQSLSCVFPKAACAAESSGLRLPLKPLQFTDSGAGPSLFTSLCLSSHTCKMVMTNPPSKFFDVTLSKPPPSFLRMLRLSHSAPLWVEPFSPCFWDLHPDFWMKLPRTEMALRALWSCATSKRGQCLAEYWLESWAPPRGHQWQHQEDKESPSSSQK